MYFNFFLRILFKLKIFSLFGSNLNRKDVVEFKPDANINEQFTKSNTQKMGGKNG